MTKDEKLKLIWRHTHKDYRGKIGGIGTILVLRPGGTTSVPMTMLTDAEIEDELRFALPAEKRRLAAQKAKNEDRMVTAMQDLGFLDPKGV